MRKINRKKSGISAATAIMFVSFIVFAVLCITRFYDLKEQYTRLHNEADSLDRQKAELEEELMQIEDDRKKITVTKEEDIYFVEANWLEPILRTVNLDDYSSLQYLQRVLQTSGVFNKLEEMGIEEGDTVDIFGLEFEYVK